MNWKMLKWFKRKNEYGWFGNYSSWSEAAKATDGYAKDSILEKTKQSLLKIKNGEAVYERDSVLFEKKEYPFPLITYLLSNALSKNRAISILDFGGSLGSTYFQSKEFLTSKVCSSYNIVEQAHYVTVGKQSFEDNQLFFFNSIDECLQQKTIDVLILSSVVQFLPDPFLFIDQLMKYGFEEIIIDRTFFVNNDYHRLTIENVWPTVYEASYPAWFFNEPKFLEHFTDYYEVCGEFPSYVKEEIITEIDHKPIGYTKGFFLKKKL